MAEPAFDTLTIAKELEHDYGYEQKQAEGVATIIYRHLVGNVATKDDLRRAKEALEEKIEVQSARIQNLDSKVQNLDSKVQNLDSKVQNLDSKVQNLDSKVQNLDSKVQDLDSKIQNLPTRDDLAHAQEKVTYKITTRLGSLIGAGLGILIMLDRVFPVGGG